MLNGKLALITGSTGGIGLVIAETFAKEGAHIAMVDLGRNHVDVYGPHIDRLNTLSNKSQRHSYYSCDVSKQTDVKRLFKEIEEVYPKILVPNVIVNCAGVYINKPLVDFTENDIDFILDVNLKGTILVTQEAIRKLLENVKNVKLNPNETYASIINISSMSGKNGCPGETPYSASKAGIEGFTRSVAKEFGLYQIRSNAILPGLIRTPMLMAESRRDNVTKLAAMASLRRIGEPIEVANLCLFLASEMSSYITAASIDINGGLAF